MRQLQESFETSAEYELKANDNTKKTENVNRFYLHMYVSYILCGLYESYVKPTYATQSDSNISI